MARIFTEADCDPSVIKSKRVAVIGYGSQGHAHALNLRDSGVAVTVGLYVGSSSWPKAEAERLAVKTTEQATRDADVLMLNLPDGDMARIYRESIAPHLRPGQAVLFSHGFNIHYKLIQPPADVDVLLVAPKGQGHGVRREYLKGGGLPALLAVAQDSTGNAEKIGLSYAWALGCARAMVVESTFRDETEADLFAEQAVLCGGTKELVKAGFQTLVDAGYSPETAFFECLHELKLIVDLLYEGGITHMLERISDTAEWGAYIGGPKVISEETRKDMRDLLARIQDGSFAKEWIAESASGKQRLKEFREAESQTQIELVGKKLRARMPFLKEG
ncbi:MAG: ketol-acid reductoisomerase [Fimbriimonadaceae bacterium]|jgi:ketol-acid reductoisomerase|nr:ketol-acid reductoisomerase [Fimbriimonadaceae bacterium]